MIRKILTYSMVLLTALSCTRKMEMPKACGALDLTVSANVKTDVQTRTSGIYDDYNIHISGIHTGNDPYEQSLVYGAITWPFALPYGLYSIEAESCTEAQAHAANDGYGCVRFQGLAEDVQVKTPSSDPTSVSVVCTMANAKVSVAFDEGFLADFEDVSVELVMSERTLCITSDQASGIEAYFNVDASGSEVTYSVYGSIDDVERKYTSSVLLQPAKHAHLVFKSNHNGVLGPQISVDKETGTNEITGTIVPEEGSEVTGGDIVKPVIYVDYEIKDAVEYSTVIDVIDKEDMTL